MTQLSFKSAGVSARVINRTGPTSIQPAGIPAGVVGTSQKGPAFVPVTVATPQDFVVDFGNPADNREYGPLAATEWLRNQQSATFLRVLGAGAGKTRETSGVNAGRVNNAGFVVGDRLPQRPGGGYGNNSYAALGGDEGRTYFLGCYMRELGSIFSDVNKPSEGVPVVRGVLMAPSGVLLTLSSSRVANNTPGVSGSDASSGGSVTGSVNLASGRQEFVMMLNGFENSDPAFPTAVTASFDPTAPNYFGKIFNTDPFSIEKAGHYLYADWKIDPSVAVPSGSTIVTESLGGTGLEDIAFLLTSSLSRNSGSVTVPNYENFEDRYTTPETTWVISQKFGGNEQNLFKISTLSDGEFSNNRVKISIENITPGTDAEPYGRFDLLVRRMDDTDKNQKVLEGWRGVNLDPESPNYIARIIGDYKTFYNFDAAEGSQKLVTNGTFTNKSRYIRVEMAESVENGELDSSALPFGFRGAPHLMTSGSAPMPSHTDSGYLNKTNPFYDLIELPVPFRENLAKGAAPSKTVDRGLFWGVQFEEKISASETNSSEVANTNINAFNKYYPKFHTNYQNVVVSNNHGTADTAENGVIDADRFNFNKFSLSNVRVALKSNGNVDTQAAKDWAYVRNGVIPTTSTSRSLASSDLTDSSIRNLAKFSFFLHGGFDGSNVFDREMFYQTNVSVTEEINNPNRGVSDGPTVTAYDKALDILADETEVDIQLLTTPGIRHSIITDKGLQVTEDRFDALYIMDVEEYDTLNVRVTSSNQTVSVVNTANQFTARGIDSSFGAAYFPNVVLEDQFTGVTRIVPPSVAVLGAFAKNDAIGFPWNAPAGFTRGALETTERSTLNLSRPNMDTLQDADINPIVSFANSDGNVIWGQKTLLARDSSLERVNVRRLLIDIRRKVKAIGRKFLFEPGREETLARFSQVVNPVLKRIQDQNGLEKFLVRIDTSTTTEADIQNKIIRGQIFLTPAKTLEFLAMDFVVSNEL